jgi:hypothetical protein
LQRQNVSVQPGDAVIIHAGWARLRVKDNARYMKSNAEALPMPDVRSAEVSSSRRARY